MAFAATARPRASRARLVSSVVPCATRVSLSSSLHRRHASSSALLNTGETIPLMGFGTWQDKDHMEEATTHALKTGYRHIDSARIYGTEPAVGNAIRASGVPRDQIFLTTKLWNNSHRPESVKPALEASLADLQTDYLDLYLMHWPNAFKDGPSMRPEDGTGEIMTGDTDFCETWRAMEELLVQNGGKVRAIGISNFSLAELRKLLLRANVPPAVHQLEMHPYLQQRGFMFFHQEQNIHVTHYSPFGNQNKVYGKGQEMQKVIDDPVLAEIGRKYGKTGAQVALAWGINSGRSVIPKSKTAKRIQENFDADFPLNPDDMAKIATLDYKIRFNDPSKRFKWNFYSDLDGKEAENAYP